MAADGVPDWLAWARRLQAIAQTGLHYAQEPNRGDVTFDLDRYREIADIARQIVASEGDMRRAEFDRFFGNDLGHATPKVEVRGVVFDQDRVLLVRERSDGWRWTVPGGWAEAGETPATTVEREVREESGYEVRATKLLALFDRDRHHVPAIGSTYKLFFRCALVGGSPADSYETTGAAFFAETELPELSTRRVTAAQLARFFEHLRRPELPTDFD